MADARIRIRLNGTAEAASGTEYTKNLFKVRTTDILNAPSEFDIILLGSSNISDIATGKIVELYWGTTMSVANRFFKGYIKTVEEQTAKKIRIAGKGAGWSQLIDRKHPLRVEWGSDSRTSTTITRTDLIDELRSRDLDGASTNLIDKGTIISPTSNVNFFDTSFENRINPFIRCAELWDTDVWFDQDDSGNDRVNITPKGSDKTGSVVFYLSGLNKNAKVGSNILDVKSQFTQVTVVGAGDGYGQITGSYPSATTYSPASPEKEKLVIRPELKIPADCVSIATTIHSKVSQPVRRVRFSPDSPGTWITNIEVGDIIRITASNLANLDTDPTPFDTKIYEITFSMDFESGKFDLVYQTENRLARPFDRQANTDHTATEASSSATLENRVLNLLKDIGTTTRVTGGLWNGGILAKKIWLTLGGTTDQYATQPFEGGYPLILDGDANANFSGHILFRAGVTADPGTIGVEEGALYYNSLTHLFRFHNGTTWGDLGGGTGAGQWSRNVGPPTYVYPTIPNDNVYPNSTGDFGSALVPWTNLYLTNSYITNFSCTQCVAPFIPNADDTHDLGQYLPTPKYWRVLYVNDIDAVGEVIWLGSVTSSTVIWGDLSVMNDITLGSSVADTLTINALIGSPLLPSTINLNIGQAASPTWKHLYLEGGVTCLTPSDMNDISCVDLTASGDVVLGNTGTDTVTFNGRVDSDILPSVTGVGDLGNSTYAWHQFYGTYIINHQITTNYAYVNQHLYVNGNATIGNSTSDTVIFTARIGSHFIPSANYNLGQNASPTWANLYLTGDITCDDINCDDITCNDITMDDLACDRITTSSSLLVSNLNAEYLNSREVDMSTTGILAADVSNLALSNLWHIEPQSSSNSAQLGSSGYRFNNGYFNVLSKISGTFQIDHPLDPKNKWLSHSFVEAPEMILIYKGRASLKDGKAIVTMPSYFHALNGDENIEYNLTPIGHPSMLYIAKEMKKGTFEVNGTIDGDFSWIVYSVRQDRAALAYPVIVERDKEPETKGNYVLPMLYEDVDPGCTKRQQEKEKMKVKKNG